VRSVAHAQELWDIPRPYLNTASFGLPPKPAWDALQAALADWREGRTSWEHWCDATERSREHFAALVGMPQERVAAAANVSYLVGAVAASLREGSRVLVPEVDFSSLTWPFLAGGGLEVRSAPIERLAEEIDSATDVVAFSAVQSSDGTVADLASIAEAARDAGVFTVVDATHAVGWLPLDASRFDAVACSAYKWLMSPRGTAFLALSKRALEQTRPSAANWYAAEDPFGHFYDPELRLAADARRLDLSPAWFSWVGTEPALKIVRDVGVEQIHAHDVALANRFRAGLGLRPATRPSSRRTCRARRRSSPARASVPPFAAEHCAPRSISTTPRRTWTRHSRR
jgi:selenocysteine lyase/cysteine desulfurase